MFSFFPSKLNSRRQRLRNCSQPALSSADSDVRSSASICSGPDDVPPLPDSQEYRTAYTKFLINHPEYTKTRALDALREQEFARLNNSKIIYMDATGASLYPESLVRGHLQLLSQTVFGNTHSDSPSSRESEVQLRAARSAVLSYFGAPESEYVCIFTANCTGALKLVGESYPFTSKSRFVLAEDSHNSVNGIRVFAERAGASVHYVPGTRYGGFDEGSMQEALKGSSSGPSLVAITGQSNVTGYRPRLVEVVSGAKKAGYDVLLDAAALASTAPISLGSTSDKGKGLRGRVDAMAISFYKMFGYPTGVGALIARKDFLERLRKPWFAGGTVEVVGFPSGVTETAVQWERFEEGTTNYTSVSAIPRGLDMLSPFVKGKDPVLPLRLSALHIWLHRALQSIVHTTGLPVVNILTMDPEHINSQSDSMGYILSMTFHNRYGNRIPNDVVSQRADKYGLSLRTGCVCNPGGVIAIMGLRHKLWMLEGGLRYQEIEARMGVDAGVVRLSLGITSSFRDVFETARFVSTFVE